MRFYYSSQKSFYLFTYTRVFLYDSWGHPISNVADDADEYDTITSAYL